MNRVFFQIILAVLSVSLTCCSAIILASEDREPDSSVFQLGANRQDVEKVLGEPLRECRDGPHGSICAYEYNFNCDDAKDDVERSLTAAQSVLYDVQTLFLMELFSTPYFLITCGRETEIFVTYDENEKVTASNLKKP